MIPLSARRPLTFLLVLASAAACGGGDDARGRAGAGAAAEPPAASDSAPRGSAPVPLRVWRDPVWRALLDTVAAQAARGSRGTGVVVGRDGDTTRLLAKLETGGGIFTLVRRTGGKTRAGRGIVAALDGREVLRDTVSGSARVHTYASYHYRTVVLLELAGGADGCPLRYRVFTFDPDWRPIVTPEFGNCSPAEVRGDERRLEIGFARFAGAGARAAPAVTYEYRGRGRLHDPAAARGAPAPALDERDTLWAEPPDSLRPPWNARRPGTSADASGDTTYLRAVVHTPGGLFALVTGIDHPYGAESAVVVDGAVVLQDTMLRRYAFVETFTRLRGRDVVLVGMADGGNACEAIFRIFELAPGERPAVTREFGTCAGAPDVALSGDRLRMRFSGFWHYWQEVEDPDFQPPPGRLYEYRGRGRLRHLGPVRGG